MSFAMNEFAAIRKGIHSGFQRCSKELKRFEDLTSSETRLVHIRKRVMDTKDESVNIYVTNKCLDILVKLSQM